MIIRFIRSVVFLALFPALTTQAQEVVFYSGFEFEENPLVLAPSDLNGSTNQVGSWSGDAFPDGQGNILVFEGAVYAAGIVPSPLGGSLMVLDRPTGDPDRSNAESEEGDFTGAYFANLAEAVPLVGTQVSFRAGTRRSANTNEKDYDIIGLGSDGTESFHVRVGTENTERGRIGYLADFGGTLVFDLPTVDGEDKQGDMPNIFGFNAVDGPGLNQVGSDVVLHLQEDGFFVNFSHPEESTSSWANAYTTELLPYNEEATDLATIQFTYEASVANPRNSGYTLDEVLVTHMPPSLLGDCNADAMLDTADLQCVASIAERDTVLAALNTVSGDLNGDGAVTFPDFLILSANFGKSTASYAEGNIDLVNGVAFPDFLALSATFGAVAGAGVNSVPEPDRPNILLMFIALATVRGRMIR